ncbi:MAG: hypothetical protein ACK4UN_04605 [Limisphaerales bacterium]
MKTAKPILVLLLVFFTGIAVGVFGTRYVVRKQFQQAAREGGFFRDRMERELITKLDLTPEQHEEVKKIFSRSWEDYRQLRSEFHPRFVRIADRTESEIKAVLTPGQRAEFERMVEERKARWRPPGGRPPGPDRPDRPERRGPPGFHRERPESTNAPANGSAAPSETSDGR